MILQTSILFLSVEIFELGYAEPENWILRNSVYVYVRSQSATLVYTTEPIFTNFTTNFYPIFGQKARELFEVSTLFWSNKPQKPVFNYFYKIISLTIFIECVSNIAKITTSPNDKTFHYDLE